MENAINGDQVPLFVIELPNFPGRSGRSDLQLDLSYDRTEWAIYYRDYRRRGEKVIIGKIQVKRF